MSSSSKKRILHRRSLALLLSTALLLGLSGAALAYFTSTGSGTGSVATGTSSLFTIVQDTSTALGWPANTGTSSAAPTAVPLTPGGPTQAIGFTITNPNSGYQYINTVNFSIASVPSGPNAGDVETIPGNTASAQPGCLASWFAVSGNPVAVDQDIPGTIEGSNTYDETYEAAGLSVTMINEPYSQDACDPTISGGNFTANKVSSISQSNPTSDSISASSSSTYSNQLIVTGNTGTVTFTTTHPSSPTGLSVSSSGAITTSGALSSGTYVVSGTMADTHGDTGSWSFTLYVAGNTSQSAPTSNSTSTTDSSSFTDQLSVSGSSGTVTYTVGHFTPGLTISTSGAITTTGSLVAGTYTATGTDTDSAHDTGTWSYSLTVSPTTITQGSPTTNSTDTTDSSSFSDQLTTSGGIGTVTYSPVSSSTHLVVSLTGAITTTGSLAAGTYTASGTTADAYGDTGSYTYSLTVTSSSAPTYTPIAFFALNDSSGSTAADTSGASPANDGTYVQGPSTPGPYVAADDTISSLNDGAYEVWQTPPADYASYFSSVAGPFSNGTSATAFSNGAEVAGPTAATFSDPNGSSLWSWPATGNPADNNAATFNVWVDLSDSSSNISFEEPSGYFTLNVTSSQVTASYADYVGVQSGSMHSSFGPTPGDWTMISFTYQASGALLYINGTQVASGPGLSVAMHQNWATGTQGGPQLYSSGSPAAVADQSYFNTTLTQSDLATLAATTDAITYQTNLVGDGAIANFLYSEDSYTSPNNAGLYPSPTSGPGSSTATLFPAGTYVSAPNNPSAELNDWNPSSFSINAWVNLTDSEADDVVVSGPNMAISVSSGSVQGYFCTDSACDNPAASGISFESPTVPTGTWSMITLTYDSSTGIAQFYLDGVPVSGATSTGNSGSLDNGPGSFQIGAEQYSSSSTADVGFFDAAISPSQIAYIYAAE